MSFPSLPLTSPYSLNSYILVNGTQQEQGQGKGSTLEEDHGTAMPQDLSQNNLLSRSDSLIVTAPIEPVITSTTSSASKVITHHPGAPHHYRALHAFFNKMACINAPGSEEAEKAVYNCQVHHAGLAHYLLYPFTFEDDMPHGE